MAVVVYGSTTAAAATTTTTTLFIFMIIIIIITCSTNSIILFISATNTNTTNNELVMKVCKNTTNFAFCHDVIYSDPRASDADRYVLSYIAFGQAYTNATHTQKYINLTLKKKKSSLIYAAGLKKCQGYYSEAIRALVEMLGDLDSESFYGLDKLALDVDGSARACEASFRGQSPITMSNRNHDLIQLSNICLAVSNLYSYN